MPKLALSDNAMQVLERRYLQKNSDGTPTEEPIDMFRRVAHAIAAADKLYDPHADVDQTAETFLNLMTSLRFLPNSPTLMNAGRPLGQLSACFVLPVEDSMEGIFESIKQAALIHKSGGGTGFSFSRLRSTGSVVGSTGGVASGPISFMRVFNTATEAVKQGGTRRGANMGILRVDHPDILSFITCKENTSDITNFNISVGITEVFMEAVREDREYDLIDPHSKRVIERLSAREVFQKIVNSAWSNGEPGIIFLDRLNRDNVVPSEGEIESTNPCGEQPLLPYESCNLGSINLVKMLKEKAGGGCEIDARLLRDTVTEAVHFLDNVIDVNLYPFERIAEQTKKTRKIGLGVMGFADMLLLLGVPYDSDVAVELAERLMEYINRVGHEASEQLALTRGTFPLFQESIYKDKNPIRNGTVTTIAPTGTISIISDASSGVEPIFGFAFVRNVMDGTELPEVNPILQAKLEELGLLSDSLMKRIATEGSIAHIEEIPADVRTVFRCAHDVSPEYHIRIQAAFQRHTDNAVSKTVNFSKDATPEQVYEVYMLAYELGCKGVTIYRDGSRENQVLNLASAESEQKEEREETGGLPAYFGHLKPRPRPAITKGFTERVRTGCGNLYITVNYDENGICEVFTSTGKGGGCPSQSESTARLVSIAIRSGVSVEEIFAQLKGIRCPSTVRVQGLNCTSCPDAIARVIHKVASFQKETVNGNGNGSHAEEETAPSEDPPQKRADPKPTASVTSLPDLSVFSRPDPGPSVPPAGFPPEEPTRRSCPDCGSKLLHEGGCVVCRQCGYSKCG